MGVITGWACFVFYEAAYLIHFFLDLLEVMLLTWILVLGITGKKVQRKNKINE